MWGRVGAPDTDQVEKERNKERGEDGFAIGLCGGGDGGGSRGAHSEVRSSMIARGPAFSNWVDYI